MKQHILPAILLLSLTAAAPKVSADVLTVDLAPSPDRVGAPGSTIYFGFSLFWQSDTMSLLVTNSYLTDETNPLFGTYADIMGTNGFLNILGPSVAGAIWAEPGGPTSGAGSYAINSLVPIGDSNSGKLAIDYLLFDLQGGSSGGTVEVPFSVTAQNVSAVPEPSSVILMALGLVGTGLVAKAKRYRSRRIG